MEGLFFIVLVMLPLYGVCMIYYTFIQKILSAGCTFVANLGLIDPSLIPDAEQLSDIAGNSIIVPIILLVLIFILSIFHIIDMSSIIFGKEKWEVKISQFKKITSLQMSVHMASAYYYPKIIHIAKRLTTVSI